MFIGHWAPAFAAAAISKKAPKLAVLFIAAQFVDWLFFIFAAIGIEKMRITPGITAMNPLDLYFIPYTHSLLGSLLWALAFIGLLIFMRRDFVTATIGGLVVLSHWFIDLLVHQPDLTLAGGDPYFGFALWNYPAIAITLELAITIGAFLWYIQRTRGPVLPPWILLGFLLLVQIFNWFAPQPTEAGLPLYLSALAAFGIAAWMAHWVGGTRQHNDNRGLAAPSSRR